MLTRRDYSVQELLTRLVQRGFETRAAQTELEGLVREGLLNETRFVENFIHARRERGQGPCRIRGELLQRGVSEQLVDASLDERAGEWLALARRARAKRFDDIVPAEWSERARQARFLRYRGFTEAQIRQCLKDGDAD